MFATIFVLLYVAHLLADYPFQTDHQAAHKAEKSAAGVAANLSHATTHVLTSGVALIAGIGLLGLHIGPWGVIGTLAWIAITHAAIDRRTGVQAWMRLARQTQFAEHGGAAHVDQTAHITALAIAALTLAGDAS
ncbi:DUF3307 domain-containing protein [Nocardioides sp. NPDC087217]|uniref:DUF3307 domain-containing protein n=1 Tax=Nocardioides sp. NPDC087217 TaxID=3364335 RepID=UPI0037FAE047